VKAVSVAVPVDAGRAAGERKIRYGLKLTVGLALVAWLVWQHGWRKIVACLAGVSPAWFALTVVTYLAGQSLCAWKWGLLAESLGFRRKRRFYWVNYLGGMFCSLFLPTSVGGDVYRVLALAGPNSYKVRGKDRVGATVSVLADRGTGVLAMVWIAALAASVSSVLLPRWATAALYLVCAALTLGFAMPFWYRPRFARSGFLGRVMDCWDSPALLLAALGAAFLFQALLGIIYALIGQALGLGIDVRFYFLLCPLVSIAAMAPVSINGLGVREATLAALFPLIGIGAARAVAFGLAWTATVTLADLFGGVVLLCLDAGVNGHASPRHSARAGIR
jgi:glycosyltransferase 2 family protein